jgi:3-hydroxyisobutyrate dehydrogenase
MSNSTRMRNIAFIGTGIMGSAIAGHLMDAGYCLTVHNRTKEKAQPLLDRGALWADTAGDAVRHADVVFTMLGYPKDVEEVYLSTDGLLSATRKGAWMIDLTTSSPQLARDIHGVAEISDKHAVDCPVTGGEEGAMAGTLTLMLGCSAQEAEPILPLLQTFGSNVMYFDKAGAGQMAKLCNQISLASCMVGYAEALALADQAGLDTGRVRELVLDGTGASAAMERLAPLSMDGDFKPRFMCEHLLKDLALALDEADEFELSLPGTTNARNLYDVLCQVGGARLGSQAVSLLYADESTCTAAGLDWNRVEDVDIDKDVS